MDLDELIEALQEIRKSNSGKMPIYFDTEARTFEYHMAKIGSVYAQEHPTPHISLHEEDKCMKI